MGVQPLRFVSVKLTPVSRAHLYAVDEAVASTLPRPGDAVLVPTEHGPALGTVVPTIPQLVARRPETGDGAQAVVRLASHEDIVARLRHQQREQEAYRIALLKIRERGLAMKLSRVEQAFDGSRVVFYFTADARVDFRELVRDLAARYHGRIELRQVGVRDEAKIVGGIGSCGRELCCSTFLPRFAPVSIKMAKHQNLAMSPARVSGQCGRLKCCLVYEDATYLDAAAALPKLGKRVGTPDGVGRVGDLDVLRGRVRVYFEGQPPKTFTADELQPAPPVPPTPSNR